MTSVTDALAQITSYAYDEVGNRISQTDANNHTTAYAYDRRGRRTQRTLPLGQTEGYTYDAAGSLLTRTDFNGRVTTYTYDASNRLLTKTADPYFAQNHIGAASVTYSYNAQGQRYTMTDASGTTYYLAYDNNGHVTQIGEPSGIRLFYGYDAAGNLKQFGGANSVNYSYDVLNRMTSMSFSDRVGTFHTAAYGYDNVGNLQSVTYPNGVVHTYGYDNRNRLTNLSVNGTVNGAPGALASYGFTLDAAGHRTSVTELSGRTVNYAYDSIYRLTNETITSDPGGMNGAVGYTYDPVGNRTQKVSTLPGYPGGLSNYNANDQLSTDTYDNAGNTTASNGTGYAYDFENHLVQAGAGISIVYDGDGNRVSKTVAGVTTNYLVDPFCLTGNAQVVYETISGSTALNRELSHTFSYGLELVNEARSYVINGQSANSMIYFDYDGHGSVRALADQNGSVTDTYDYDAFGNLIHSTGTTPNNYLFAGEQFDPDLHLYYNRARYLNTSTGRFWTMDPFEGDFQDPMSLHKYLYGSANPVSRIDPSGNVGLEDLLVGVAVALVVFSLTGCQKPGILKPPQKPTFRADGQRLVQDPQTGLQEVIRVDAAGPDAQDNYLVVQWVKGSQKVNGVAGLTVNQDQEVPNDFSSYRIDVPSSAKAEYPTLVKTSTEVSLFDTPGITSHGHFPSGMALAVDQDFKITVYDLHKYPANTPVSAFSDPWSPAPLDTFDWSFHASYTVP